MAPCLRGLLWAETEGAGDTAGAVPFYFRRAQVLRGYDDTVFRLTRLREQARRNESQDARTLLHRRPDTVAEIDAVLRALERLRSLPERLPSEGSPLEHAAAIDGLIDAFSVPADTAPLEAAAAAGIRGLLELLADEGGDAPCSRDEFCARFARGMEELTCAAPGEPGGVNVLHADGARNRRFAHVFVAGLMEGQAPAADQCGVSSIVALWRWGSLETNQDSARATCFGRWNARLLADVSWRRIRVESGRALHGCAELFPESAGVVALHPRRTVSPDGHRVRARRGLHAPADTPARLRLRTNALPGGRGGRRRHSRPTGPRRGASMPRRGSRNTTRSARFSGLERTCRARSASTQRILQLDDTEPRRTVTPLEHGSLLHDVLERFHRARGAAIRYWPVEALAAMDRRWELLRPALELPGAPRGGGGGKRFARASGAISGRYALEEEAA